MRAVPGHPATGRRSARGRAARTRRVAGNQASTRRMFRSASRSGTNFSCEVWLGSNSQSMCAQTRPLASALASSPYRQGECGSPSLSLYLWCRRWSATQVTTGPSIARLPAIASATRSGGLGLERAVREVPVVADGDAEPGDPVEDRADHDVVPAEAPAPGERDRGEQRQHRNADEDAGHDLLCPGRRLSSMSGAGLAQQRRGARIERQRGVLARRRAWRCSSSRASGVLAMFSPEVGRPQAAGLVRLRNRSLRHRRLRKSLR